MKKRNLIPCLVLTLWLIPAASQADAGSFRMNPALEPDGLLGLKWGDDLSKVPGMIKTGMSGASDVYKRRNECATIGLVLQVHEVRYYSYNGQFYAAKIFLEPGEKDLAALKAALTVKYGSGLDAGGGNLLLVGKDAGIHLRLPPASQDGWSLAVYSRPLTREADRAARRLQAPPQG